jgi:hypothetical protein
MSDTVAAGDFGRLIQVGAIGVVALGLLTLVVALVKQFAAHALDQNKELIKTEHDMQLKTLESLHAVGQKLQSLENQVVMMRQENAREFGQLYNEVAGDNTTAGSRAHRIKPPPKT